MSALRKEELEQEELKEEEEQEPVGMHKNPKESTGLHRSPEESMGAHRNPTGSPVLSSPPPCATDSLFEMIAALGFFWPP